MSEGDWRKIPLARQTKERAEQTREDIIDAGIDVFFRQGVARASLEEVARTCGMTRGAVYWHFRGKHDLFIAIEDRLREPQRRELDMLLSLKPSKKALAVLRTHIVRILTEQATDENIRRMMTVVLLRIDSSKEVHAALERQANHQRHFRDGIRRYFNEIVPPPGPQCAWTQDSASDTLFALTQGTILRALRFPEDYPLIGVGISVVETLLDAFQRSWLTSS